MDPDPVPSKEGDPADKMADDTFNVHKSGLRSWVSRLHRTSSCHSDEAVRQAAIASIQTVTIHHPLLVLQTWIEQYATSVSSSSATELSRTLHTLDGTVEKLIGHELIDLSNTAHAAALSRVIGIITEEMTKNPDVVPDIQKPCSSILVRLGEKFVDRVMDKLLLKFQPGTHPHYYVITTLSSVAIANSTGTVPFLKAILGTMLSSMKSIKKDNLKLGFSTAFSRFSESILDYLANIENTPDPSVTKDHFTKEIDQCHEILFSSWLLPSREVSVRHGILEALGQMSPLLSDERLYKNTPQILTTLIGLYKRWSSSHLEPYFVTLCISQVLDAVVNRDPQILEGVIEPLLTALFTQVCQHTDYEKPYTVRNHNEVLRCYDVLIKSHGEKLISGLTVRLSSVDENIRLGALTVFKHLMTSSLDQFKDRMPDIQNTLYGKLSDHSNKVRKMLAQLTALLGRLGYLEGQQGRDFIEFIVRLCALPPDSPSAATDAEVVTNNSLKDMCDNILLLLTNSVEAMQPVLWPHLLEYLLAPDFTYAIPSVTKSLAILAAKKRQMSSPDYMIDYSQFQFVSGPYVLFARLLVLAAFPFTDHRGGSILTFIQNFAPNINKHLATLWDVRVPLLQTYLEKHANGNKSTWNQTQWEDWLLALLDDTLSEIDLEEWTVALAGAMCQQFDLYSDQLAERSFLMRCLGHVLKKSSSRSVILDNLSCIYLATNHMNEQQQISCAKAFGICASKHLDLVLDKLESLLKAEFQRKSGSFLGNLLGVRGGSKADEIQIRTRCTILRCVGFSALNCSMADLVKRVDIMTSKFVMPAIQSPTVSLKEMALVAMAEIARAINTKCQGTTVKLAHQVDLIHESIECLQRDTIDFPKKHIALATTLELVRIPPYISQMTRCTLLKACFSSVFPAFIRETLRKIEDYETVAKTESHYKQMEENLMTLIRELLQQELEQSTLDEIFTMLEKYMSGDEALARKLAMTLMESALATFVSHVTFPVGHPTAFAPGPYMIGSVVPRCFDTDASVQEHALRCLDLLLRILALFEGMSKESMDETLKPLKGISTYNMEKGEKHASPTAVSNIVAQILIQRITHDHLQPLCESLIDNLLDRTPASAKGTSIILCRMVEARGGEIYSQAPGLVDKLHGKLGSLGCSDARTRSLHAVRTLASHNPRGVLTVLLSHPLPQDDAIQAIWKEFPHEPDLAGTLMHQLLEIISSESSQLVEETDVVSRAPIRKAKHAPVAAILALGDMFQMKEMEAVCAEEFAKVFVPLLFAMSSFLGVKSTEIKTKSTSSTSIVPYTTASNALRAFLICKGCSTVAEAVDVRDTDNPSRFAELVADLVEAVAVDTPQYLPKLVSCFKHGAGSGVTRAAFHAQIIRSTQPIDPRHIESAIEYLLSVMDSDDMEVILALAGLACYKDDQQYNEHAPAIVEAFIRGIDYDSSQDVNYHSLVGLAQVLDQITPPVVHNVLTSLADKVRPFFDCGRPDQSGPAIRLFAELARFATGDYRDVYVDLVHSVMVSLLLHLNDENEGTAVATKDAFNKIFPVMSEHLDPTIKYSEFLVHFAKLDFIGDRINMYITVSLSYFKSGVPRLRANAALVTATLILSSGAELELEPEVVCEAFAGMLADSNKGVAAAAAENAGKVFVHFYKDG